MVEPARESESPCLEVRIRYFSDIRFPLERANGVQTMETCHALAARGHQVVLGVRPDTVRPARDPFEFYGLPPVPTLTIDRARVAGPPGVRRMLYVAFALERASARRADVILTRDLGVASVLLRLPRWRRPPLVFESHGFSPVFAETMNELVSDGRPARETKQRRLYNREARVWKRAEGYVTTTRGLATELETRFGPRRNVTTVPNGVRLPPGRRFRASNPHAEPLVLYAGHLYPWKGVDVLLHAVARLPEVRAVVVGGHPAEGDLERLRQMAQTLGVSDRVDFRGMVPVADVQTALAAADVLVLPTTSTASADRYTSPLKLFEYLAVGRPIVASDLQATREVLEDGRNAILVAPSDADALAAGIRRAVTDASLAAGIARAAFDDAAGYTWERRAERVDQLLQTVQAGR